MAHRDSAATVPEQSPTTHAMLIVWGHFARAIGLLDCLVQVPILQKTVVHAPQAKLTEFLIGLLSGIEYLTDLSEGAAPLVPDPSAGRLNCGRPLTSNVGSGKSTPLSRMHWAYASTAALASAGDCAAAAPPPPATVVVVAPSDATCVVVLVPPQAVRPTATTEARAIHARVSEVMVQSLTGQSKHWVRNCR